jgi:hypothetical protein
MRARAAWLVAVTAACGGPADPGRPIDAAIDGETVLSCAELQARYREIVLGVDDGCSTPADCELVGGVSSCDCEVYFGPSCWGHPVNRDAFAAVGAELAPVVAELQARCTGGASGLEAVCDCEPWAIPTCEMGHCDFRVDEWCLQPEPPPDAGP